MIKHTPYFELLEAQRMAGCSICRLTQRHVERYLDALLYEAVLDEGLRERLRRSRGFCQEHAAMLRAKPGRSLGIALIYASVLEEIVRRLEALEQPRLKRAPYGRLRRAKVGHPLEEALAAEAPCPACQVRDQAARDYLAQLVAALEEEAFREAYAAGDGLCLAHLTQAVALSHDEKALERLLQPQLERYHRLLEEVDEFIRKADYRFREEALGPEGDVWLRVLNAFAGGAGLGIRAGSSPRGAEEAPKV